MAPQVPMFQHLDSQSRRRGLVVGVCHGVGSGALKCAIFLNTYLLSTPQTTVALALSPAQQAFEYA